MANTFIKPSAVASLALGILVNNLAAVKTFDRSLEGNFTGSEKRGQTVRVRRRFTPTVSEFTGTTSFQDVVETDIDVTLEKHFDVSVPVSSKQMTLELQEFGSQIVKPCMDAMAEKIDSYALTKLKHLPYVLRPSNSAPGALPASLGDIAKVNQTLSEQKVPVAGRMGICSPEYYASLAGIPSFTEADKRGEAGAIVTGRIGRVMGLDNMEAQGVDTSTFTSGTMTSCLVNGAVSAGATTIVFDGASGATHTLKAGDIINIAGYGPAVVAADVTASSSAGSITLVDPLRVAVADNAAITTYDGGGNTRQLHGAYFNQMAFAFVSVPLVVPPEAWGYTETYEDVSIRVVRVYDINTKESKISFDCLVGTRCVHPRLGGQIVKDV